MTRQLRAEEAQTEGWKFLDKTKETCSMTPTLFVQDQAILKNRGQQLSRIEIWNRIITFELIQEKIDSTPKETWCLGRSKFFSPTKKMILEAFAVYLRIQGLYEVPHLCRRRDRPLEEAVHKARLHFGCSAPIHNSKYILKILGHFLFDHHWYEAVSRNCQGLLRSVGRFVSGDEKLFHFTGDSPYIMCVPSKPSRTGLWIYELACQLENGLPFLLHFQMLSASRSLGETSPVHDIVSTWATILRTYSSPCTLVFDSYYFSKKSLGVLMSQQQQPNSGSTSDSALSFIGAIRKDRYPLCEVFLGKVKNRGDWECLYNEGMSLALVNYFSPQVGSKFVLSNAFCVRRGKTVKGSVPIFDDYQVSFDKCDKFNKRLYHCTWPHKHGGYNLFGDKGHQHDFLVSSVLQNVFNVYMQLNGISSSSIDFSSHCLALADELFALSFEVDS